MALVGRFATRTHDHDDRSLGAVDAALAMASRSSLVTVEDALHLLRGVEATVGDQDTRIAGIVSDAAHAWAGQLTLDRDRLTDTLLDIRLVISD
jgi:hypothetical protein